MSPTALNIHFLLRNKHILLPIFIITRTISILHLNFPRRQLSAIRLQSFKLRTLHVEDVFTQMLHALHDGFAFDVVGCGCAGGFAVHFVGDEGEFVGALEQDVEGGFELEDGFEDGASAENVETQTGARECDGQAANVT